MGLEASSAQAKSIRQGIMPDWVTICTMFNQPIRCRQPFTREAQPEDRWFAGRWLEMAQELLDDGAIAPNCYQAWSGGLFDVTEGMNSDRKGTVAGAKIVFQCCSFAFVCSSTN